MFLYLHSCRYLIKHSFIIQIITKNNKFFVTHITYLLLTIFNASEQNSLVQFLNYIIMCPNLEVLSPNS